MTETISLENVLLEDTAAVRQMMELVDIAASQRGPVVVAGESEAGHEMVARAIHVRGEGADGPFVRIDCSKGRPQDLERELFGVAGHAAGSTADNAEPLEVLTRTSRLFQASGGTLFLQHVSEMPAAVQARLTRLLEQGAATLEPTDERVAMDIRLVIAADAEFDLACTDGRVLADLHRVPSGLRITFPALGTRQDDIPALAAELLDDLCKDAKVPRKELTSLAQILLTAVSRRSTALELRFLLEDLVMRVRGRVIRVEDLLASLLVDGPMGPLGIAAPLRDAREQFERQYISAVLQRHRGRIPHAARALGIQRANLYRKLRHLHVAPDDARSGAASRRTAR